ncbi:neutral zinc metallopeptidase [Cognatiyoonia sp. IB215446]|uniref:neutral zinc metallopeptidase n=1 Tax=Cognatiyoonia sp. IB215446 TaxID=3097355 RepID=UPI002A15860E|nr:neutral zinc metallopeptidase [Cognatiyoonia sp. IB215446]MDX8349051.1 neutral zinc metallopeptidase [Cognatiyoonia sp. IB215446]
MRWFILFFFIPAVAIADPVEMVEQAAKEAFDSMPPVQIVREIAGRCGADANVNPHVAYCTSQNVIFLTREAADQPQAAYLVAHSYGHAVQVRHGVADFALAQIRARRDEEAMLRGLVERQVDCIAGFLVARAGLPDADLTDWFDADPFDDIHWGRNPLSIGPVMGIDLADRDAWFQIGQEGDITACGPGEFTADLLVAALRK